MKDEPNSLNDWAKNYNVTESIRKVQKARFAHNTARLFELDLERHTAMDESEFTSYMSKDDVLGHDRKMIETWKEIAMRRARGEMA